MKLVSLFAASAVLALPAYSSVSLTFSNFQGALTGLSDGVGAAPVNNLTWGILIDTKRDGLPEIGGVPQLIGQLGLNLTDGIDFGDGDLFYLGGLTVTIPGPQGGQGGVSSALGLNLPYLPPPPPIVDVTTGIAADDPFYVMWFDTGVAAGSELVPGTNYGLVANGGFLLPPDGNDQSYTDLFPGIEPTMPAEFSLVPEPSLTLLLCGSFVPFLRRRR